MKTCPVSDADRRGVIAVPPLCRRTDGSLDPEENLKLVRHLRAGGITRLMYGGNAFLYHITLREYAELIEWLEGLDDELWVIPSAGPSYGRLMDQAELLRETRFPCVMALPCADPRDARGIETGLRRFADRAGRPLIVYIKEEQNFGADLTAGLDAVARLVRDGVCVGIKYAVVRQNPAEDAYLEQLLERVERRLIFSGIGERPAVTHLEKFGLPGFTSGSVCLAPALSQQIWELCEAGDFAQARLVRERFIAHEDLRDAWGPARVIHAAVELAGIAKTGPIPPFVSELDATPLAQLRPVALELSVAAWSGFGKAVAGVAIHGTTHAANGIEHGGVDAEVVDDLLGNVKAKYVT
jgi:dihydrodipicolinate synthase/N-acetylneuraminate lyase